ncbi:hypothetical protein AGR7C_Cc260366 [Agrobacterium deltaense Zutra 3/1]|uniref:Uncharacterized protein n=1 Tax=Agrobacterium deltaense Zutra 3/1 TaxID=1183427 RepID=A0A1S7QB11_9HYPH|nr:hypothetical protein AGR7C_Cc260366 [Agrobacterium deltaense Zutra 3/1]
MQYAVLLRQLFMKREFDFHQPVFDTADLGVNRLHHALPRKASFYPLTKIAGIRDLHGLPACFCLIAN